MRPVERHLPLHVQMAAGIKAEILEGRLLPGTRLPSIREMAATAGTGANTAQRAVEYLKSEGLVRTDATGTYAAVPSTSLTPVQRLRLTADPATERQVVTAAGLADVPAYVSALLGLEEGGQAAAREWVTYREGSAAPCQLSRSWCGPGALLAVPELREPAPLPGPRGAAGLIAERAGLVLTRGRTSAECRLATAREAELLDVPEGTAVLATVYWWAAGEDVLEYGAVILPPGQKAGYDMEP